MTESDFASGDWFNATNGTNSTGGGSGFGSDGFSGQHTGDFFGSFIVT